ncbi:MAG: 3-phosphoshikimate 1-carboxyvinyltransferase, partial [Burkholderiales bacterium]
MSRSFRIAPGGRLSGEVRVPGDKSISHRSVMLGAIAEGVTEVTGFLEGADAISTMEIFRALGVRIDGPSDGRVTVRGVGLHGLRGATQPLDCGNAGTAMRLLMGLLAGQRFESILVGDESLSRRPM